MSTIAGLLGMIGQEQPRPWDIATRSQTQADTGLLDLADLKRKQASEQAYLLAIQNDPELRQRLFGGSTIGSLQTAPAAPPGAAPMTQQSVMPGQPPSAPQVVPGGQDLSQFATQGQPGTPTLTSLGPQGGMPGPQMQPPPQNPLLEMARRDPRAAMMLQQQMQTQQDRQWKMQEQQLDMGVKVAEFVARELQGVTDQASLDAARERVRQVHPQAAAQIPQMYSKEAVASVQQRGIALAQRATDALASAKARHEDVKTQFLPKLFEDAGAPPPAQAPASESVTQAPAGGAGNMGQRMNNPYNIKLGKGTQHWVDEGLAEVGESAQDGGKFIKFKDPQVGERAGLELLQGPGYRELSVDAAMKRWSNNGYGAEIIKDIPPETKIKDLSAAQMRPLMAAMREREGWNAKPAGSGTAQAPPTDPRVAQLQTMIDEGTRKAKQAAALGYEGLATQYNNDVQRLTAERTRLEAPQQEYRKKLAVQELELEQQRQEGLARAQLEADTKPASNTEIDAINRALPPDKQLSYGTTYKEIREKKLIGAAQVSDKVVTELTTTTTAIQNFEELSNAVTALPTGPLTQYVETFKERWGIDISDEKVAQRAILAGARNQLLQARSGAAVPESEYQRLLQELPHEGNDPKVFKARLANTVRQFKNLYKTRVQILRKTGHAIPDDLMEPLAAPEAPPAPKVSTAVDKARDIMKPR